MKLKEAFLWVNVFIFVLSILLSVFFFEKIWNFDRTIVNEFKETTCTIDRNTITSLNVFWPCQTENNNLWWYTYFQDDYFEKIVLKGKAPTENVHKEIIGSDEFSDCYHGVTSVHFNFSNPLNGNKLTLQRSNITGLYSSNYTWVQGYMANFENKTSLKCYYKPLNPYQVLPFPPEISNIGLLWACIFLGLACISFVSIIILFIQRYKYRNDKYQNFLNNSNNRKSMILNLGSSSGKISTAGIPLSVNPKNNSNSSGLNNSGSLSSSPILSSSSNNNSNNSNNNSSKSNNSKSKNKHNIIESTLEFKDFQFNLTQATNQKQPKPILKNQLSSSPTLSSSPSSNNNNNNRKSNTTYLVDQPITDSFDELLSPTSQRKANGDNK